MGFIVDNINETYVSTLLAIIAFVVIYIKWKYTYWEKRNITSFKPRLFFGNLENPFTRKTSAAVELQVFYEKFKSLGVKHGGIYSYLTPAYIPIDLEYVKNILSADFEYFSDRGRYFNEKDDPLSANLANVSGEKWKNIRVTCTPTFTSGKMKKMFATLVECGESFRAAINSSCVAKETVEIKSIIDKFTIDVIGNCVFGIQCNSFVNSNSEFRRYGNLIFRSSLLEAARSSFTFSYPELSRKIGIRRYAKEATDFFMKIVEDAINYRETNNIRRNDFLQILIDLQNNTNGMNNNKDYTNGADLTMKDIAAQSILFFVAGFDTSSLAMSFILYELASNSEMQEKVRKEIDQVLTKHNGQLTYEALGEMKYMQQVMNESFRKYPPVPILNRQCTKDYKIPGTEVILEKGTQVIIPLLGIQYDLEYFPDPEKFDPERFSAANKNKGIPFTYLPFGDGPRNCIGKRFGEMQIKTGLTMLLQYHTFTVNSKTIVPLQMDLSFMSKAKGGIWLDIANIK